MTLRFTEFVYTGNHAEGKNSGNYEELEEYFCKHGFIGDFGYFFYLMNKATGTHTIKVDNIIVTYTLQRHKTRSNFFGYTHSFTVSDVSVEKS